MVRQSMRKSTMLLVIAVAFLLIQYGWYYASYLSKGVEVVGTDTFMRLVRVEELHDTGQWFDSIIDGSNAPYGDELHWTRPVDVMLYIPAFLGALFSSFSKSLYQAGIWIGPILGVLSVGLVVWMPDKLADSRVKSLLLFVFITQPIIYEMFMFGRPDHHSLIMVLFLLVLGVSIRALLEPEAKKFWLLGSLLGICFWVSVESLVLIVMVFSTFGCVWIGMREKSLKNTVKMASAMTLVTFICILLEKPLNQFWRIEYDKVSFVYAVLFVFITAIFWLAGKMYSYVQDRWGEMSLGKDLTLRSVLLGGLSVLGAVLFVIAYPDFIKGPFADVNPAIKPIWLDNVAEVQPLMNVSKMGIGKMLMYMGLPALSSGYIVDRILHAEKTEKRVYLLYGVGMILYIPLSLIQVRWAYYLQMMTLLPAACLLKEILIFIERYVSQKSVLLVRPLTILLFLFVFTLTGGMLMIQDQGDATTLQNQRAIEAFSNWVNSNKEALGEDKIVLTFLDFGPELLYRTHYPIIAAPYHRNDEGILFSYDVMTSQDLDFVKEALSLRQVDWILLGPGSVEEVFYNHKKGDHTFYDVLVNGTLPDWVEEVSLPDKLSDLRLFVYKKE